jgi:nitrate reductase gamma subunit
MSFGQVFLGIILPYAALLAFLLGLIFRIVHWSTGPQMLKWTLYPLHSSGKKIRLSLYQIFW